ncbi:cholesterol esterase [Diplodia seriata]|uniref:Cholesterol esterase n=1 Tax=Diplodia seriata TaxID=420778 RepID=A0A1S8B8U0_9PEZI|nr:putative lipase [Diplodia seriata]
MPQVPFIGRLHPLQYVYLLGSFVLIALEAFIRIITLALPGPVIHLFYRASRKSFNYLSSPQGRRSRNKKKGLVTSIAQAADFVELAELFGYYAEEHIVQTGDGYLLGLHRLAYRRGEEDQRVNHGPDSIQKRVVYLHHGLMMNSEVWLCLTEKERCLPFMLVERGYDVWLGNNRGNKYSKKSTRDAPTDNRFWNFSMDQFAFHDIPDSIDYILSTTGQQSLSYVGFSQGTAQAFAALSIHPTLNEKVNVFVALAPAMSPKGMSSGIVDTLVKSSPDVLFLAFGRRAILTSTAMWQSILYPPIFVRLIDGSLSFLFGWSAKNITPHQKLAAYPHLYSFSSVKTVVHWFQIIRNGTFQMYDDEMQAPMRISNDAKYYKVAKFPTRNIKTPIVLVYGGSDSLVDVNIMLKELPKHTVAEEIPHYEHLDFLWANNVEELVFPHVYAALDKYAGPGSSPKLGPYKALTPSNTIQMHPTASFSDDDESPRSTRKISENVPPAHSPTPGSGTQASPYLESRKHHPSTLGSPVHLRSSGSSFRPQRASSAPLGGTLERILSSEEGSHRESHLSQKSNASRPEGWWSSDEVGGTDSSPPPPAHSPGRASFSSLISQGKTETKFGSKGITLGAGKAVGGLVSGSGTGTVGITTGGEPNAKKGTKKRKQ